MFCARGRAEERKATKPQTTTVANYRGSSGVPGRVGVKVWLGIKRMHLSPTLTNIVVLVARGTGPRFDGDIDRSGAIALPLRSAMGAKIQPTMSPRGISTYGPPRFRWEGRGCR